MHSDKTESTGRSFASLNLTQFLGALNDNLFKLLLIFFLIEQRGAAAAGEVTALAGTVFVLPFLLFSPVAGMLADRVRKNHLIVGAKALEVAVMTLGTAALALESAVGLYAALFLMSLQSTLFGPAKYGIVPELVSKAKLSRANGTIEAFTYLAIILGTTAATLLPLMTGGRYALSGMVCIAISALGLVASFGIRQFQEARPARAGRNFRGEVAQTWRLLRSDRHLSMAVAGSALFMLVGGFVQLNLIPLGIQSLGLSQEASGLLFLVAALGIGTGALLAGRLSGRNVELGVVPLGAGLLCLCAVGLGAFNLGAVSAALLVLGLGLGAGLFIVPLHAFIQFRSPQGDRGKLLAAMNLLGWCGVLVSALATHLVNETLQLPAQSGFLGLGLFMAALFAAALAILPDFLLRFIALVLMRAVYRVRVQGAENVPVEGGALLVANHVSWIDALLLLATQQRRIRFLMERRIYERLPIRRLLKLMGVIPISSSDGRRELVASLAEARKALDEGYLVCIFAEGAITRNGALQEFRPGFERIVKDSEHPVVPVHLGGVWGSTFSYRGGRVLSRIPTSIPEPVVVGFGEPMPAASSPSEVRQAVMELSCRYFETRRNTERSLGRRFVKTARANWRSEAVADATGRRLSYGQALVASLLLRDALRRSAEGADQVGILLPPSVGAALCNLALTLSRKVPVNLNYTASRDGILSAIAQAEITTVITSRLFLRKFPELQPDCRTVYLEDLLAGITPIRKLKALAEGLLAPTSRLAGPRDRSGDELATIIFSSGSTSEPKGVMLSHHNIVSNIEALGMIFPVDGNDSLCGVLPFFHSFGFTGTLWMPLTLGFSVFYHPTPLDATRIVRSVREKRSTFLLATPTFLSAYLRRAKRSDFASLRLVVTGAERLSPQLASAFREKFGITPLEGYGATELAPVAAINLPDVYLGRMRQIGSRPQSVGRPLPGMAVRIVDPETGEALPPETPGMILLRGPNVMRGYLKQPEKTRQVLKDGWYETGDIGCVDAQGFLKITGRLSRFSKIGGEMVPHVAVEEALLHGLGTAEQVLAVTSVPDERKGERLVVLYEASRVSLQRLRAVISASPLPNLWKPVQDASLGVEKLPLLGSGKLDLRALKKLAEQGSRRHLPKEGEAKCV